MDARFVELANAIREMEKLVKKIEEGLRFVEVDPENIVAFREQRGRLAGLQQGLAHYHERAVGGGGLMEPTVLARTIRERLEVLEAAIRKQQKRVDGLFDLMQTQVEATGSATMPEPLQTQIAYRDGLIDAWKIMTGVEWKD